MTGYSLLLDNDIIISCCEERKQKLEKDLSVRVMAYGVQLSEINHCHWQPCLKGVQDVR